MAETESSHTDKNPANDPLNTAGKYYKIKEQVKKQQKITKVLNHGRHLSLEVQKTLKEKRVTKLTSISLGNTS